METKKGSSFGYGYGTCTTCEKRKDSLVLRKALPLFKVMIWSNDLIILTRDVTCTILFLEYMSWDAYFVFPVLTFI